MSRATTFADVGEGEEKGKDDFWSYVGFTDNDEMGFYASGGNLSVGSDGKGEFVNERLTYKDGIFKKSDGATFSPTHMNGSQIFMYFPYDENINIDADEENKNTGMELRVINEKDNSVRCVDFLSSTSIEMEKTYDNGNSIALYGTFTHAFSELIIMRGEGFDEPPKGREQITVVLQQPVTHIQVKHTLNEDSWSCTPVLVKDDATPDADAKKWVAWQGENYGKTEQDKVGKPAWYVIVPTLDNPKSTVEYIELYDNEGNLLRVSSLKLDDNTKNVKPGWRYPIEITMKELVPTVNPFRVVPWNDDVDLTDKRERGINNEAEFAAWVRDYNAYLLDRTNTAKSDALLPYGDRFLDAEGNNPSWHFYLLADLDLNQPLPQDEDDTSSQLSNDVIIQQLRDTLDGIGTTLVNSKFSNHTITGLSKTFIGTLASKGLLQNFDFIKPNIINSETSTVPAGIITNEIKDDGSVINCNIKKGVLVNPGGPAGMVAGTMSGGTIKDCTLSGFLVAETTANGDYAKIIGEDPTGNATLEGNDATDVSDEEYDFDAEGNNNP